MKTFNERIYEEILEPMFPGEFSHQAMIMSPDYNKSLEHAFWLAEQVGLFKTKRFILKQIDPNRPNSAKWVLLDERFDFLEKLSQK